MFMKLLEYQEGFQISIQLKLKDMKSKFLLFLLIPFYGLSQELPVENNVVKWKEVVKTTNNVDSITMYQRALEYFSSDANFCNRQNKAESVGSSWISGDKTSNNIDLLFKKEAVSFKDENKKIVLNVVNKYTGSALQCVRLMYITYNIEIQFKDGRYKVVFKNFNYTHYNLSTLKQQQLNGFVDKGDCKSKGELNELKSCDFCSTSISEVFMYIRNDIKSMLAIIKTQIDKPKNIVNEDDW